MSEAERYSFGAARVSFSEHEFESRVATPDVDQFDRQSFADHARLRITDGVLELLLEVPPIQAARHESVPAGRDRTRWRGEVVPSPEPLQEMEGVVRESARVRRANI
jgi:hypothetical protein